MSENDVDMSFHVEIEEGPSEEITGDVSGSGSLQLHVLDGGATVMSHAEAALRIE